MRNLLVLIVFVLAVSACKKDENPCLEKMHHGEYFYSEGLSVFKLDCDECEKINMYYEGMFVREIDRENLDFGYYSFNIVGRLSFEYVPERINDRREEQGLYINVCDE